MKMIFKYLGRYPVFRQHGTIFIVLSLFASAIYADVTVNNLEKNDKIVSDSLSVQNVTYEQAISEQAISQKNMARPDTDNESKDGNYMQNNGSWRAVVNLYCYYQY